MDLTVVSVVAEPVGAGAVVLPWQQADLPLQDRATRAVPPVTTPYLTEEAVAVVPTQWARQGQMAVAGRAAQAAPERLPS